jgi:hypothetical protein
MVRRLKTGRSMIPEVAAEQSIFRIGANRDEIPEEVWNQIVEEVANMIDDGLDLDPNNGKDLAVVNQNTHRILTLRGIIN